MPEKRKAKIKRAPMQERKLAYKVLEVADLATVRLLESNVKNDIKSPRPTKHVEISVNGDSVVVRDHKRLAIKLSFKMLLRGAEGDSDSLKIDFTYLLLFNLSSLESVNSENAMAFTKWIGMNIGWPYAREYVRDVMGRLGMPSVQLPLFKTDLIEHMHGDGAPLLKETEH